MNEKSGPEHRTWRPEDLRGADLRGQDLTGVEGLLPEHLAGADLTGAKLPDEIAKFPALEQVKAISSEARKVFIGLLAACVYSWLVIGTTTDVALIRNTASSPLPIINTPIPIAGFYVVGAALLAAVYCYFHFYLLRLWRTLAALPAVFPDGVALDDRADPWLLTGVVRIYLPHLPAHPLGYLENLLSVLLAWWLVPITLFLYWARFLPAHDIDGLAWLALLIAFTIFFGQHTFSLARAVLRREVPLTSSRPPGGQAQVLLVRVWRELWLRPEQFTLWFFAPFLIINVSSVSALSQSPRDADTNSVVVFSLSAAWQSLREVDPAPATLLNFIGIRTYADLREVEVAQRPEVWTGKEWEKVKRVDLRDRNLAFADLTRAFLANADLRGANLTGAVLERAELQGVVLYDEDRNRYAYLQGAGLGGAQLQRAILKGAQLQGADFRGAHFQGADLGEAQLQGTNLGGAQLQVANLERAQLQGADLRRAQLQGADLWYAQLQGANLSVAQLQGANVTYAQLQGANLREAELQGAELVGPQLQGAALYKAQLQGANLLGARLQGADLRAAGLWRASVPDTYWDLADLSGANVVPMADSDIDALISEIAKGIPDEERRNAVTERLIVALRTGDRPSRPDFPEEWRSEPNVMFEFGDPRPEPFEWGPLKWESQEDYEEELAKFFGELACGADVPEGQVQYLVRRALSEPFRQGARVYAGDSSRVIMMMGD